MFTSPAYAQAAGPETATIFGADPMLIAMILIFVVFWFLLIRPQQKKMKQHKAMVEALRRGDRVVTGGGMIGTVAKVTSDTEVMVDLAEGVRVRVLKHTVQDVLAKTEPAKESGKRGGEAKPANDPGAAGGGGFSLSKLLGGGGKPK